MGSVLFNARIGSRLSWSYEVLLQLRWVSFQLFSSRWSAMQEAMKNRAWKRITNPQIGFREKKSSVERENNGNRKQSRPYALMIIGRLSFIRSISADARHAAKWKETQSVKQIRSPTRIIAETIFCAVLNCSLSLQTCTAPNCFRWVR